MQRRTLGGSGSSVEEKEDIMSLISVNEGKEWAELGTLMDEARSDVSEYVYIRKKMEQMGK